MLRYSLILAALVFAQGNDPSLYEPDTFISLPDTQVSFADTYGDIIISWAPGKTEPVIKPSKNAPVEKVSVDPMRFKSLEGLARVLKNNSLILEIGCHTDAAEKPSINEALSLKRAKSIKQKLISLGVDSLQLHAVGYGGSVPDKWYSKSIGVQHIRRAELRITRRKENAEFSYSDSVFYPLQVKRINFTFSYDKTELINDSIATSNINGIVQMMNKNEQIKIIIAVYTDSRGNGAYNAKLSQHRARTIFNTLKNNGIAPERMSILGGGEWNPIYTQQEINALTNKQEQEWRYHQNRRTEIILNLPFKLAK